MKNGDMPAAPIFNSDGFVRGARFVGAEQIDTSGITKREHFAAMAMQGMLSSKWYAEFCNDGGDGRMSRPEALAAYAVKHADALLDELERDT